jgi:hypothetical protein
MIAKETIGIYGKYFGTVVVDLPTGIRHYLYNTPEYYNLITNNGRTWFVNRYISNGSNFVESLAVGTGTTVPLLNQTTLVTETAREPTTNSVITSTVYQAIFTATFAAALINGTTEIGVFNDLVTGSMLARNVHSNGALNVPPGSSIVMQYIFGIMTAKTVVGWTNTSGNVYQMADNVLCNGILETDTGNGYLKQTSIATVQTQPGSYWHDSNANITYIHCTDGLNPSTHNMVVIST